MFALLALWGQHQVVEPRDQILDLMTQCLNFRIRDASVGVKLGDECRVGFHEYAGNFADDFTEINTRFRHISRLCLSPVAVLGEEINKSLFYYFIEAPTLTGREHFDFNEQVFGNSCSDLRIEWVRRRFGHSEKDSNGLKSWRQVIPVDIAGGIWHHGAMNTRHHLRRNRR